MSDRDRLKPRTTPSGHWVRPIHFTEVEEFDPRRKGRDWVTDKKTKFGEKKFAREYDIDFSAASERLIYPGFSPRYHVLVKPVQLMPDWNYWIAADAGVGVTCHLYFASSPDNLLFEFDIYYEGDAVEGSKALDATQHARNLVEIAQGHANKIHGLDSSGNPRMKWGQIFEFVILDKSCWRRDDMLASTAQRYAEVGVNNLVRSSKDVNGGIEKVKQLEKFNPDIAHPNGLIFKNEAGENLGAPQKYLFPDVWKSPYRREKENYRRVDDTQDKIIKMDDHAMDSERYGCVYFVDSPKYAVRRKMSRDAERLTRHINNSIKRGKKWKSRSLIPY